MGERWADGTQIEEDDVRGRWGGVCFVVVLRLDLKLSAEWREGRGEIQGHRVLGYEIRAYLWPATALNMFDADEFTAAAVFNGNWGLGEATAFECEVAVVVPLPADVPA